MTAATGLGEVAILLQHWESGEAGAVDELQSREYFFSFAARTKSASGIPSTRLPFISHRTYTGENKS
jgi:hypothetical protein